MHDRGYIVKVLADTVGTVVSSVAEHVDKSAYERMESGAIGDDRSQLLLHVTIQHILTLLMLPMFTRTRCACIGGDSNPIVCE
jgi:hypothetical protein